MIENLLVGALATGLVCVFALAGLVAILCVLGTIEARAPGDN